MKNEKELWIEKMMNHASVTETSFNTQQEVLAKILDNVAQQKSINNIVSFHQFRLAGVAAIAILALNIGVIAFTKFNSESNANASNSFALNTYNLDLY